jgi:predicted transcriptional regulator
MGQKEKQGLTRLELKVMQVVWRRGPSNVTEVQEDLDEPLAYTTVQTMLNILERKGKVKRKLRGRAYEYSAAVSESKAVSHAVRDLVDRMFGGSSEELVMSLIKSRQLDRETIARLTKRLEEGDGE